MYKFYEVLIFLAACVAAFITWGISHFFLSRRDYYWNSPYKIFTIKLGWSIGWFLITLWIGFKILEICNVKT